MHAGERAASGAYADAHALQHAVRLSLKQSSHLGGTLKANPESGSYLPKSNADVCLICWELYDVFGSRPSSD